MNDFDEALRRRLEADATAPPFAGVLARVRRRRTARRVGTSVAAAVAVVFVVAIPLVLQDSPSGVTPPTTTPSTSQTPTSPSTGDPSASPSLDLPRERPAEDYSMSDPPQFHVMTEGGQVDLRPWSICGPGYCADGFPDDTNLVDAGGVDHLEFGFDLSGWEFQNVTFRELDTECPRAINVEAIKTGERTFRIDPAGPAGRWAVDIFGRGPSGDAVTTVEWTTSQPGTYGPPARGIASVLADQEPGFTSYGVELSVRHLDDWYPDASATIKVTSATGGSVTIPVSREGRCGFEGDLFFTSPQEQGMAATRIGEGPFRYVATLDLGETTYVGTGIWPDNLIPGSHPSIGLRWEPPLPGYRR